MPRRRRRTATIRRPASTLSRGDTLTQGDRLTPDQGHGTPGTPQAPSGPQMPAPTYDSSFWNEVAGNEAYYQTGMAGIGLSRSRLGFDTGFGANGQVDLSNPYSQAMMLQRSWEQGQRGTQNSMAAAGQLYSGARKNAITEGNFQYERNRSNLQTSAQRGYEDLTLAERGLADDRLSGNYAAHAGQAERWRDQERDWYRDHA